jgi:hypothetical protein
MFCCCSCCGFALLLPRRMHIMKRCISALLLVLRFALRNRFWAARFARLRPSFIQAGFAISSMQSCQRRIFCLLVREHHNEEKNP